MYDVKSKVGHLWICYGRFWSTAKFGDNWKRAPLPHSSPSEGRRGTVVLLQSDRKQMVPFTFTDEERQYLSDHRRGKRGGGCSFSAVPKFRRRPKPTIPLHSKFINDQLCFWHYTFSTNTTRRGEPYLFILVLMRSFKAVLGLFIYLFRASLVFFW